MQEEQSLSSDPTSERFPYFAAIAVFSLILLIPVFIYRSPFSVLTPDIVYVKAKILRILHGELFTDPITGFPNFHPPYFHLVLSAFVRIGLEIDTVLTLVSVVNLISLMAISFFLVREHFDRTVASLVCALLPFIVLYIGCGNLFLPTAFFFSLPIFLTGFWLYTKKDRSGWGIVSAGVLWGLAFSISPMYLFVVGFTLLADIIRTRSFRQFGLALAGLMVGLIPFFIQAYVVVRQGFFGTGAFAFWRGVPDLAYWKHVGRLFLTPLEQDFSDPLVWVGVLVTFTGLIALFRVKGPRWIAFVLLAAYFFTQYNYVPQYAIRVHFILSLFLAAFWIRLLLELPWKKTAAYTLIGIIAIAGVYKHFEVYFGLYNKQAELLDRYYKAGADLQSALPEFVDPGEYLLVTAQTYLIYVMPVVPAHALVAYWSGEYFQLAKDVSDEYQRDYQTMINCESLDCLNYICEKYSMRTAIVHGQVQLRMQVFTLVDRYWKLVYSDDQFRIYKRPQAS